LADIEALAKVVADRGDIMESVLLSSRSANDERSRYVQVIIRDENDIVRMLIRKRKIEVAEIQLFILFLVQENGFEKRFPTEKLTMIV